MNRPRVTVDTPKVVPSKVEQQTAAVGQTSTPAKTPLTAPEAPKAGVAGGIRLAAELAAQGMSVASARTGLVRALSTELLLPTRVETEELASSLFADLRVGKPVDARAAVSRALDAAGPLAVAELCAALAWRLGAAAADGAEAETLERCGSTLDAIVAAGVQSLATRQPHDSKEALATTIALSALLSGGQTLDTAYYAPADCTYAHHFDAFTNERNLPGAIDALPATGGAMVGVSGGALQTAVATRAEVAVVADINPEVRDFSIVLGATAMLLDDRARAEGWSDERLGQELQQRLLGAQRGNATLVDELRALGMPEPILARTPAMAAGLYNESGMNQRHVWLAPKSFKLDLGVGTARDDAEVGARVRQIATLARGGGLVAPVMDLSDPDAPLRLRAFLDARGTKVTSVHLSNALDYVLAPKEVVDHLAALPHEPKAVVLSSTAGMNFGLGIGDWNRPGVNGLDVWLGQGGIRERLRGNTQLFVQNMIKGSFLPYDKHHSVSVAPGTDPAAVRAQIARIVEEHYADEERAYASLVVALQGNRRPTPAEKAALVQRLRELAVPPPRNPDQVRALVRALRPLLDAGSSATG
ncbi:MAG: hypothetical protein JXR83_07405 [Deltaproteobacteria bacterium]|nr:hypothetical protein [Deltaproteobacteria bacterium]